MWTQQAEVSCLIRARPPSLGDRNRGGRWGPPPPPERKNVSQLAPPIGPPNKARACTQTSSVPDTSSIGTNAMGVESRVIRPYMVINTSSIGTNATYSYIDYINYACSVLTRTIHTYIRRNVIERPLCAMYRRERQGLECRSRPAYPLLYEPGSCLSRRRERGKRGGERPGTQGQAAASPAPVGNAGVNAGRQANRPQRLTLKQGHAHAGLS